MDRGPGCTFVQQRFAVREGTRWWHLADNRWALGRRRQVSIVCIAAVIFLVQWLKKVTAQRPIDDNDDAASMISTDVRPSPPPHLNVLFRLRLLRERCESRLSSEIGSNDCNYH